MVSRIHYIEAGVEYVLQFNSRTDTVELRQIRHTLIGGIPNYFRDTGGVLVSEIDAFKEHLLNWRPCSRFTPLPEFDPEFAHEEMTSLPQLTDAEIEAIDEFEDIAEVYLCLTPNSVVKYRKFRENPALSALRQFARQLRGLDMTPLIQASNSLLAGLNTASVVASQQVAEISRQIGRPPEELVGVDMTRRVNYREILSREFNTPSSSDEEQTEIPSLSTGDLEERLSEPFNPPNTPTDVNDASLNRLLNEIEEAIEDDDRVRGAPTHPIYLSDTTVTSLSREARQDDEDD